MSKGKLTAAEWEMVKDAPFWVNRVLNAADNRVAIFGRRRDAKALEEAMKEYKTGNALLKDIVADDSDPAKEIGKASQEDAELALGRIATIVQQKLGDDDVKELRAFLLVAGRAVASASREGVLGKTVSDKEEAVLKRVENALRPSAYSQAQPAPKPAATSAKPAPKPASTSAKPAPAPAKRDDEAQKKEQQEKNLAEAKERQERAREKAEAKKDAEAKERLEKARQEAEARQREAKAKAEAEATAAREEAARKEAEAKAAAEQQAAAAPKYTQFIAEHTVQAGDNLSFISQRYYGHQGNFRIIYEANRDVIGDNMNLIRPGQVLKIPKL